MPDPAMAQFTTVFRASEPRRVKRNRQTVSCTACQRRKSRCDRRQPCGACEKRGDERTCQFAPASSVAGSSTGSRQEVQNRLHKLEEMVRRLAEGSRSGPAGAPSFGSRLESATGGNDMDIDTAENDRQGNDVDDEPSYHGPTSWAALVESIHDIQSALDAEGDEPPNSQPSEPDPDVVFGELPPVTTDDIERALPTRQDADRLVSAYFNAKYVAYPFIHTHHFRRRYETFWQNPPSTGFLWISTLFSILGVGALICTSKDKNLTAEPGPFLNMAARCLIAGRYLEGKTWSVEALTMLIHARSVQKTDADPTVWSLYALAVRLAQRQGYHRKWDQVSPKLTPFDAEMRRRVWLVLQCYDMVLSHQHGMPPMIHEDTFDAEPPTNAIDEDFDEDSVIITSRPPTDPFPITAYITKSKILPIVRRGMVFPLGTKPGGWTEIQETARDLEAWYASIPPCLRYRPIREASFTDPNYTVMHRAMLEITHYMAVCSLYRPYLTLALRQGSTSEYAPALEHCRRAALRLIEIHFEMDQATQPGGRFHEEKYLVSSLALHDFLVAAMILCIELMESRDMSPVAKEKRIALLRKAYDLWHARARESHDAFHAAKVLRAILKKVETPSASAAAADRGCQCPLCKDHGGTGPFEGGSHSCSNLEECARVPAITQMFPEQTLDFDELPALDRFITNESMLDWSRYNCPLLFTDVPQPTSGNMSFEG